MENIIINKQIDSFFNYLNQFYWFQVGSSEFEIQCIDENDHLKDHSYKTHKEAFLAGEELAILIHEPACINLDEQPVFIDKLHRPATTYYDDSDSSNTYLIQGIEACMVFTLKNSLEIKRFGITIGSDGCPSHFFKKSLHPDITKPMQRLMEQFK